MDNRNEDRCKKRSFMKRVKKMESKVSRIPTSKLAETERQCSTIQEGTCTNEPYYSSAERRTALGSGTTTWGRRRADNLIIMMS